MEAVVYSPDDYGGLDALPCRNGVYNVHKCDLTFARGIQKATTETVDGRAELVKIIKFCRRCELVCPVGK